MVADDDEAILDAVSIILELQGYNVKKAQRGPTVTEMITEKPDLLLLDIWMSGEDGLEICKAFKQDKTVSNIPIVLFSASKDIKGQAMAAGADDFIEKPFDIHKLIEKIDEHVL